MELENGWNPCQQRKHNGRRLLPALIILWLRAVAVGKPGAARKQSQWWLRPHHRVIRNHLHCLPRSIQHLRWSFSGTVPEYRTHFLEVQRNGERLRLGVQRSYFDDELQPGTRYDYSILVVDAAGNVLQTAQISATTQGDANGADNASENTVELTGDVYSQSALELFWNTDGLDESSTTAVRIYLDGRLIGESYGRSLYIESLSSGTAYEFFVAVTDEQGIERLSNVIVLETYPVDTP